MPSKLKKPKSKSTTTSDTITKTKKLVSKTSSLRTCKDSKIKKRSQSVKRTAKKSVPLERIDSKSDIEKDAYCKAEFGDCLKCKESALLNVLFQDRQIREKVRKQIEMAKDKLKQRLELELPRKLQNIPPTNSSKYKKFGMKLQVKDFEASTAFSKAINDVFDKYRNEIDFNSLGKLV